jgi:hypothetical protein
MEERLKEEVELKLGNKIVSRGDCQLLSDLIFEQQKKQVSYNTLRRFFNVDKSAEHKPSRQTLNVLSIFVGYSNYFAFNSGEPSKVSWELQNELYNCLGDSEDSNLLNFLTFCRIQKTPLLMELLSISFRESFLTGNYKAIHMLCNSKGLNLIGLNYSERVQFGRTVGLLLRSITVPQNELIALAENRVFIEMVFLIFVDYSSLNIKNNNYVKLMNLVAAGKVRLKRKDALFFQCLSFLRNFLIGVPNAFVDLKPHNTLHPILYSRVCSVQLIQNAMCNIPSTNIVADLQNKLDGDLVNRMDYIFEVMTTALLLKDFELMAFVSKSGPYAQGKLYQESHLQQVLIVKLIYLIKNGFIKQAKKNLIHVNKKGWGRSYFDIYEIYYLILSYKIEADESIKKRIFKSYLKKIKQLNYSLFDRAYILNYFK